MIIRYEDEIPQSPQVVFSWVADPRKAMQWQQEVKGGEILEERPGMVGTTFTEVIEEDGRTLEMRGTITQFVKDRLIAFHIASRIHEFDVEYRVNGAGQGTLFSVAADIHWKFPMNIISLFMRKKMEDGLKKQFAAEVGELKKLCAGG